MTDLVEATRVVIEAARAFVNCNSHDEWVDAVRGLNDSVNALASAESPDLEAKIAEALPCDEDWLCFDMFKGAEHLKDCPAYYRPAVRDLIVALLSEANDFVNRVALPAAYEAGVEHAREQGGEALVELLLAATRVYNKYGSDKDWSEWRDLRAALVACGAMPLPERPDDEPLDK